MADAAPKKASAKAATKKAGFEKDLTDTSKKSLKGTKTGDKKPSKKESRAAVCVASFIYVRFHPNCCKRCMRATYV